MAEKKDQHIQYMVGVNIWCSQGSVLGPLLFNIFINDLFYLINETDVCNYADDTTIRASDINLDELVHRLECAAKKAVDWFDYNNMKLNPDKCHLLISGHKYEVIIANVGDKKVIESHKEKLLGIIMNSDLKFEEHVNYIYKKSRKKTQCLV